MRFIVDVELNGREAEIRISSNARTSNSSYHQVVDTPCVGDSAGVVVQRILDRAPALVPVPEGKKMVDVLIEWTATSVVQVVVPSGVEDDALRDAIRQEIKANGLPEVVINETMEFMSASWGYAPRGPDGFVADSSTEIELD